MTRTGDSLKTPEGIKLKEAVMQVLIDFSKGSSRKNERYMAKHIPFFWNEPFWEENKARAMVAELARDNFDLINLFKGKAGKMITAAINDEEKNVQLKSSLFGLLSVLCVYGNCPYQENQDEIIRLLEWRMVANRTHTHTPPELPPIRSASPLKQATSNVLPQREKKTVLNDILNSMADLSGKHQQQETQYEYWINFLTFLASLVHGRDPKHIAFVEEKFVSRNDCVMAVARLRDDITQKQKTQDKPNDWKISVSRLYHFQQCFANLVSPF